MSAIIQRSFNLLEELSSYPKGRTLSELASATDIPLSAAHRLLNDLVNAGYVRKEERHGEFIITMQVVSLGLRFLSAGDVVDVAQPTLERLAAKSRELVRLALVDQDQLIYVAKAQGATQGLRYDPEMGRAVRLSCSAAGYAWLATKGDDEAMRLVTKQGLGNPDDFGPAAPSTIKAVMTQVRAARKRRYAMTVNVFLPAMSSMATPVYSATGEVLALLIVAGPTTRLTEARMESLGQTLLDAAAELSRNSGVSPVFQRRPDQPAPQLSA